MHRRNCTDRLTSKTSLCNGTYSLKKSTINVNSCKTKPSEIFSIERADQRLFIKPLDRLVVATPFHVIRVKIFFLLLYSRRRTAPFVSLSVLGRCCTKKADEMQRLLLHYNAQTALPPTVPFMLYAYDCSG